MQQVHWTLVDNPVSCQLQVKNSGKIQLKSKHTVHCQILKRLQKWPHCPKPFFCFWQV